MYHLSIQHQLRGKILLDVAYFGQNARGILAVGPQERNQINYQKYASLGSVLGESVTSPDAVAAGIKVPYEGFTGTVAPALRPFPQYLSIQNEGAAISWSTYNSVQIKLQRQWSNGLSFLVGYTISKSLSDIGTLEPGYFASAYQDAYNQRAISSYRSRRRRSSTSALIPSTYLTVSNRKDPTTISIPPTLGLSPAWGHRFRAHYPVSRQS
jgi:hypothetical protein